MLRNERGFGKVLFRKAILPVLLVSPLLLRITFSTINVTALNMSYKTPPPLSTVFKKNSNSWNVSETSGVSVPGNICIFCVRSFAAVQ